MSRAFLNEFRVATFQGGVAANENGQLFQDSVLSSLVGYGLRQWEPGVFAGVDASDGAALMQRAYDHDTLLGEQAQFKGIVVPQLNVTGLYALCGVGSESRRDLVAVIENGRLRDGVRTHLTIHIELKFQDSVGSTDDKSWGIPTQLLAGGADYNFIVWAGIGAVEGTHVFLHKAAILSDIYLYVRNRHALLEDPGAKVSTGKLFYGSSASELVSQLNAIVEAEAAGRSLAYADWRETVPFVNPSDVRTARREKQERREKKEAAQRLVQAALVPATASTQSTLFG